jgi:hypothetical protein
MLAHHEYANGSRRCNASAASIDLASAGLASMPGVQIAMRAFVYS